MKGKPTMLEIKSIRKDLARRANMFPKAGSAALNRSQQKFRVLIVGETIDIFNIKKSDINAKIHATPATPSNLVVKMNVATRRLTVFRFDARETTLGGGVVVQIKRGTSKLIRGAFINKTKSKNKMVMQRIGKERYPIKVIRTISVTEMMTAMNASKNISSVFLNILEPELTRTIKAFHQLGRE